MCAILQNGSMVFTIYCTPRFSQYCETLRMTIKDQTNDFLPMEDHHQNQYCTARHIIADHACQLVVKLVRFFSDGGALFSTRVHLRS